MTGVQEKQEFSQSLICLQKIDSSASFAALREIKTHAEPQIAKDFSRREAGMLVYEEGFL